MKCQCGCRAGQALGAASERAHAPPGLLESCLSSAGQLCTQSPSAAQFCSSQSGAPSGGAVTSKCPNICIQAVWKALATFLVVGALACMQTSCAILCSVGSADVSLCGASACLQVLWHFLPGLCLNTTECAVKAFDLNKDDGGAHAEQGRNAGPRWPGLRGRPALPRPERVLPRPHTVFVEGRHLRAGGLCM